MRLVQGPGMIRDEGGMLAGYVYVDTAESDIGGFVSRLKAVVDREVHPPAGYSLQWSGQYENMLRVKERLKVVVPITLFLIFLLLFMNTKSIFKALLVMFAVPFSAIGAIGLLYLLGYNMSIGVWVGLEVDARALLYGLS
ncbi:MAG: efflux RND transporter permease subunit [Dehalococcoidia bacterium]